MLICSYITTKILQKKLISYYRIVIYSFNKYFLGSFYNLEGGELRKQVNILIFRTEANGQSDIERLLFISGLSLIKSLTWQQKMLVKIMRNHDYQKFSQFAQHIQRTLEFLQKKKKECAITEVEVLEANKTRFYFQ